MKLTITASSIFLVRIIQVVGLIIVSMMQTYYTAMSCDLIAFIAGEDRRQAYPSCGPGGNGYAAVLAKIYSKSPEEASATFQVVFDLSIWLALVVHAVAVEVFLHYTPLEAKRLQDISFHRQVKAGLISPSEKQSTPLVALG